MGDRSRTGNRKSDSGKASQAREKSGDPRAGRGTSKRTEGGASRLEAAQQAIGHFLRSTREAQRLTQEQVASMTQDSPWRLSRAAISAIERGQNFPGMEAMLALSNVLHVDPKELIERARLSTIVPVDITDRSYEELDAQATEFFWAGDFRKALSIYDAMLEKIALESEEGDANVNPRIARLEVSRATALKRAGALLAAMATAERAITLATDEPTVQADGYIVLCDLQVQRGNLPLARDAAERAIALAADASARTVGWAWMSNARVHYLAGAYEDARQAFIQAREQARIADDAQHMTHIEGNIGMCWLGAGHPAEAKKWIRKAIDRARQQAQPALEASWLVELGKIALDEEKPDEAESYATASLRIAKPRENYLTIFRAEWLLHRIVLRTNPRHGDRHRLHYLRKLFQHLDQHEGVDEVQEFRRTAMRALAAEDRE